MTKVDDIVIGMKRNPKNVRFVDLCKVCETYFGKPRNRGSSHKIYKTPWQGDPRINIQNNKEKAKAYLPNLASKSIVKTWPFGPGQRRLALLETVGKGIQESEFRIMDSPSAQSKR